MKKWWYAGFAALLVYALGSHFELFEGARLLPTEYEQSNRRTVGYEYEMPRPTTKFKANNLGTNLETHRELDKNTNRKRKKIRLVKKRIKKIKKKVTKKKKKKKKVAKKKDNKKKKKKIAAKVALDPTQEPDSNEDFFDDTEDFGGGDQGFNGGGNSSGNVAENENEEELSKFEEWKKRVLATPDLKETSQFVAAYGALELTEGEFYEIVDLMMEDDDEEMRRMGTWALGSTVSLESFIRLAEYYELEDSDSLVRIDINRYLDNYKGNNKLPILRSALSSKSSVVIIRAANLIELAVVNFNQELARLSENGEDRPGDIQPLSDRTARGGAGFNLSSEFQSFLPILRQLREDEDADVRAEASEVITQIETASTSS